jgi:hypothetical protein
MQLSFIAEEHTKLNMDDYRRIKDLLERIEQLGQKSTQVLIFLSFAFLATVTLKSDRTLTQNEQRDLTYAMRCWALALPLILLQVFPVRDLVDYAASWNKAKWYERIRWAKAIVLFISIVMILVGAAYFAFGIWHFGLSGTQPGGSPEVWPWARIQTPS